MEVGSTIQHAQTAHIKQAGAQKANPAEVKGQKDDAPKLSPQTQSSSAPTNSEARVDTRA